MWLKPARSVRPLRHRQNFVVAQLYITEADKNAVGHGAVPDPRVAERAEPELIQIRLHVQQQTAAGDEIDLKDMIRKRRDG